MENYGNVMKGVLCLKVLRQVLELIAEHARENFPHECCGILLVQGQDSSVVSSMLPAENAEEDQPEHKYLLDYKTHLKAVEMEALGEACIAGYYHSHPNGRARPSERDIKQAIACVTYLIVGLGDEQFEYGAWRLERNDLIPEPLEVGE
jgi:proteasome lid subunit RPN8/RPN11